LQFYSNINAFDNVGDCAFVIVRIRLAFSKIIKTLWSVDGFGPNYHGRYKLGAKNKSVRF